jgi:hypothetical protein
MKIFIQMIKNDNNLPMNHGNKLKNDKNSLIEAKDSLINHENSCINNENAMRNGANSFINGENLLLNGVNAGSNVQNPCSHTVTPRGFLEIVFPTVPRGPPASQIYPLMCPTENIHCIDERILVTKQRVLEPSISDRYFITKKSACVIIGACGGVIRAYEGVVSPKDKESKSVTDQSHSTTLTEQSHLNSLIIKFTPHT